MQSRCPGGCADSIVHKRRALAGKQGRAQGRERDFGQSGTADREGKAPQSKVPATRPSSMKAREERVLASSVISASLASGVNRATPLSNSRRK